MTIRSLRNAAAWGLIAAVLAPLTSTAAFAEAAMSGSMKPFGSVRFAPDNDVRCLLSGAGDGGSGYGCLDLDPEGTRRMRGSVAFPHGRGAVDCHTRRCPGGDDRSSGDAAAARRLCGDGVACRISSRARTRPPAS